MTKKHQAPRIEGTKKEEESVLDVEDLFLLAFIKLKIGTLELDLAFRFKISQSPVSQIFLR